MCAPSPPPAPDYAAAAREQGAANVDTARVQGKMNNPNIYGPLGTQTVSWGTDGAADTPTITQSLTPDAQAALEAQQAVQKNLANLGLQGIGTAQNVLGTAFTPNLPDMQTSLDTSGVAPMPVNAGMTGQNAIMSRLSPEIDRLRASNTQTLANQGIPQGSEAWNNAMTKQGQQENDLLTQAAMQGINLDMGANNQGFGQAVQSGQFGNQALAQALQQKLALRNQPLNEITALQSGSQIQMPQFQGYQGSSIAAPPIFGAAQAAGNNAMQNYGINTAGYNAMVGGLMDMGGAAIGKWG